MMWVEFYSVYELCDLHVVRKAFERSWERNLLMHIASSVTFTKHEIYFHLDVACYQIHVDFSS